LTLLIACVFQSAAGYAVVLAELARTPLEHARGLAHRPWLPRHRGMLFALDAPAPVWLWMRDTLIPLDMIFVDATGVVVHVEESAEPLTLAPRGTDIPVQFVVEVSAGWAQSNAVEVGSLVSMFAIPTLVGMRLTPGRSR